MNGTMTSFDQRLLDDVPGWLSPAAINLTTLLVDLQRERGYITGILELGVFKGKYLSLLSHCVHGSKVPIVGVDAFLWGAGKELNPEDRDLAERQIHEAISSLTGEPSRAVLIGAYTRDVNVKDLARFAPRGFSFISVDAGHDADDLVVDMDIANRVLSPDGIAAVDDVYNGTTPGVAEGFFRYFQRGQKSDLVPFATGGNKVFMCRRERYASYLQFAISVADRAEESFPPIGGTTLRRRENAIAGWVPRLFDSEVVPFLETAVAAPVEEEEVAALAAPPAERGAWVRSYHTCLKWLVLLALRLRSWLRLRGR